MDDFKKSIEKTIDDIVLTDFEIPEFKDLEEAIDELADLEIDIKQLSTSTGAVHHSRTAPVIQNNPEKQRNPFQHKALNGNPGG